MTAREGGRPARSRRLKWFAAALLVLLLPGGLYILVRVPEPGRRPPLCGGEPAGTSCASLPEFSAPGHLERIPVPPVSSVVMLRRKGGRESRPRPVGSALVFALGMRGGIDDIESLLELLGYHAGGEEVALVTKLLGYNRELEEFPAALVERILACPGAVDPGPAVLLLDLSLKILCSPTWRKGAGSFAARHAVELVLAEYTGLYAAAGDLLEAVTETIGESRRLVAEDLQGLLKLSESVPGMKRLVFAAAAELNQQEPGWPRKSLQALEESLQSGAPGAMDELAEAAALSQLEPGEALDYISQKAQRAQGELYAPVCRLRRLQILREITARGGEEEIDQWIRDAEDGPVRRLVVSSLSHQQHSRLLERLAFSGSHNWRLQAGAVVKLSGYRADEEIAQAVLSLLAGGEPGRIDLFVQAAENLLARSGTQDSWFGPVADGLARSLFLQGDQLADPVREDLVRVLDLYRAASGLPGERGED